MAYSENCRISIIIPCFNEEGNIQVLFDQINSVLTGYSIEYIFVDDCSNDNTLSKIHDLSVANDNVKYLSFSRNFGHQSAIRAGLEYCTGDCAITMDADLQHPPELLIDLIEKWKDGNDIVYTIRDDTKNVPYFKRITAAAFYKLLNKITDIKLQQGAADFRLLDRRIVKILVNNINEYHLFYRGIISWIGFKQAFIEYTPNRRYSGESKYTLSKMLKLATNGITGFSIQPLKIAILIGLLLSAFSFLYSIYVLIVFFLTDKAVSGWTSIMLSILFVGGINMILLGIIGEYIGKMYIQSKNRPFFLIRDTNIINHDE